MNYSKILAHSRRGEHVSPGKKCDTYAIFVLYADYKFIVCKQDKNPIGITLSLRANDVRPYRGTHNFLILYS